MISCGIQVATLEEEPWCISNSFGAKISWDYSSVSHWRRGISQQQTRHLPLIYGIGNFQPLLLLLLLLLLLGSLLYTTSDDHFNEIDGAERPPFPSACTIQANKRTNEAKKKARSTKMLMESFILASNSSTSPFPPIRCKWWRQQPHQPSSTPIANNRLVTNWWLLIIQPTRELTSINADVNRYRF